jgi:deazaflavin-dependent oxidoreductase (nitroreductase family)
LANYRLALALSRYDLVMPIPRQSPVADNFGKRAIAWFAFSPAGQWTLRNISPHVDPMLIRLTRGRASSIGPWPRFVLLTHTGAKSGIRRTTPLLYFTDRDRVILIASNYGGTRHPAWYHNVKVNSAVTLYGGGFEGRFVGAEVTGAERDRLWSIVNHWCPGYEIYESSAGDRQIPLLAFTQIE